ncbi:putative ABC transport system ATP-binding protein [Paramicrobacterium humi]|uniref:Putative ABC transport system ATP-binding protein n=1 Tax=Paramicrobacterium humi TaxID=640635 RepID=A0A1H4NVA5_9MICO|nr:ABC transporter ATP-binding protein [Microbacterium humi]SEB99104.1 putative ABC transport system ATP-binding protein [Microbacterium humi]
MNTPTAVEAIELVKTYGDSDTIVKALDHASLSILRGRFTAIMGPSGSGKSTLMHAMAGLDSVDSGSIRLGDMEMTRLSERERTVLRRTRIGFVFQSFNLVPALTAEENIELPLRLAGQRADRAWLDELAMTLGISDRLKHRPSELSGGQQQRVAVARALVSRPNVVFADEPTGALDSRTSHALLSFLRRAAHEFDQTIVMVTHDPNAAAHADRVEFLSDGRVVDGFDEPTAGKVLDRMALFEVASAIEPEVAA